VRRPSPIGFRRSASGPTQPDIGPILEMHRAPDAYVHFMKAEPSGDGLRPFHSVKRSELASWFPEFAEQLARDAYFSLNAFHRAGTRKASHLRYLNLAYADLDGYRRGWTFGQTLGTVVDAQREGRIPPASWFLESGRGVWVLYMLRSARDPEMPPRAWPEDLALYRRVQMAIHRTLAELRVYPDAAATDASRVARIPGSWNSKANARAHAYPQLYMDPESGALRGYVYTLEELAQEFGVEDGITPRAITSWEPPTRKIPANRRGYRALHAGRLGDLDTLWMLRRGFDEGVRNVACLHYAIALRGIGTSAPDIRRRVMELADDCRPPLPEAEALATVRSVLEGQELPNGKRVAYRYADRTICEQLRITPEELEHLAALNPHRPAPRKAGPKPAKIRAERHAAIAELIEERFQRSAPSTRRMAEELRHRGIDVSHHTIARDYRDLGITGSQMALRFAATPREVFGETVRQAGDVRDADVDELARLLRDLVEEGGLDRRALLVVAIASVLVMEERRGNDPPGPSKMEKLLHRIGVRSSTSTLRRLYADLFGQTTLPESWEETYALASASPDPPL